MYNKSLYSAIRRSSLYWFARLILELSGRESAAFSRGDPVERFVFYRIRHGQRRLLHYQKLRAKGVQYSEACRLAYARHETQKQHAARQLRREHSWGPGGAWHPGSEAWKRREINRFLTKEGTRGK